MLCLFTKGGAQSAMATERGHVLDLRNETGINVAGLLQAQTGSTRSYGLSLDRFVLDADLAAEAVRGTVKLVRLQTGVMARVDAEGIVALECARCLNSYDQAFAMEFAEEYRQVVDVKTGVGLLPKPEEEVDEETSTIDENHELDLAEVLRQEILVALPMRPYCGAECPGPDVIESGDAGREDDRFATLARLLAEDGPAH